MAMNGPEILDWWGFRLRNPLWYKPDPLTRIECVIAWAILGVGIELIAVLYLILTGHPTHPLAASIQGMKAFAIENLIYTSFLVVPMVIGIVIPKNLMSASRLDVLMIFSRERGNLRKLDIELGVLGILAIAMVIYRKGNLNAYAPMLLALSGTLVIIFLQTLFQKSTNFSKRKWKIDIPDWLKKEKEAIIKVIEDANIRYDFDTNHGVNKSIGVNLDDELLNELRKLNKEAGGRLYAEYPEAVTLCDREPAKDKGKDEMLSLAKQIVMIASEAGLTHFQLANAVLNLVQKAIRYKYDKDSTKDFDGGPFVDYGRFPLETLYDGVGDCECTAILTGSLLAYIGFEIVLMTLKFNDETGKVAYHMAVGLAPQKLLLITDEQLDGVNYMEDSKTGKRYLYGETALDNGTEAFGYIPKNWIDTMEVLRVDTIKPHQSLGII